MGRRARRWQDEQAAQHEAARAEVQILAEGEDAVVAFLKACGENDFGVERTLDSATEGGATGRWPGGVWLTAASDEHIAAVVSYDGQVLRVEAGPAAAYFRDKDEDA